METSSDSRFRDSNVAPPGPKGILQRWKPRASSRAQLVLSALLWTAAAGIMGVRAFTWLTEAPAVFAVAGIALGLVKARLLLDAAASRAVLRIQARGRDACAGGFLSVWSWALVLVMIAAGHALRLTSVPRPWLGLLYAAVATGLLFASRTYWKAASAYPV